MCGQATERARGLVEARQHVLRGSTGSRSAHIPPAGGQFFNVFNLGKSDSELQNLKTKELKNGEICCTVMAVLRYILV